MVGQRTEYQYRYKQLVGGGKSYYGDLVVAAVAATMSEWSRTSRMAVVVEFVCTKRVGWFFFSRCAGGCGLAGSRVGVGADRQTGALPRRVLN